MFNKILEDAKSLIKGTKRDDMKRGMGLAKPGTVKMQNYVSSQVFMLTKDEGGNGKPLVPFQQLQMYSKTWDCACQLNFVGKDIVITGEDCSVDLKMIRSILLEHGQRFTLLVSSVTVGTGIVTEIKTRLLDDERRALLEGKKAREKKNGQNAE